MKREQKGITLIALIITIIVMLILVGVTINVALNGGLFTKAEDAKNQTNLAKEKEMLQTKALGYLNNDGYVDLAEYVSKESPLEGYTLTDNTTYVTASNGTHTFYITKQGGITNQEPPIEKNEYGFYFNSDYICVGYGGREGDEAIINIFSDGRVVANTKISSSGWQVGESYTITDMANVTRASGNSLQYDTPYEFTGTFGESYSCVFKSDGYLHQEVIFSNIAFSDKKGTIAPGVEAIFSVDGTSFTLNGGTYNLVED